MEWKYEKIIPGSKNSKYDFGYIAKFNFECWSKFFSQFDKCVSININNYIKILCENHIKYELTGQIDLEDDILLNILSTYEITNCFMRLSYRSAKDIPEGRLPINNVREILYALIKSERCFDDMIAHKYHQSKMGLSDLYLHLIPFRICHQERELRCFVYEKKLVAITNQFPSSLSDNWPFSGLELLITQRVKLFIVDILSKCNLYDSFVIDIEIDRELSPILIEFNPYGVEGSTGAILFDWIMTKRYYLMIQHMKSFFDIVLINLRH